MASARSRRRNPYRPGSASYAQFREGILRQRAALARFNATRAKAAESRRRATQRASAARRQILGIETREEFRSKLSEQDRAKFSRLPITRQDQLITLNREYPGSVPKDLPDPFFGPQREPAWRLYYSTRAGIRQRPLA
jgi:hypothetical protein